MAPCPLRRSKTGVALAQDRILDGQKPIVRQERTRKRGFAGLSSSSEHDDPALRFVLVFQDLCQK